MMKLFYIYFREDQLAGMDPRLTPFDNTVNERPELREYHNFVRIASEGHLDGVDYWGAWGPRWELKMRHGADVVFDSVKNSPGHDVYLFNHARIHTALTYNVWDQGELFHKGIRAVAAESLAIAGYDRALVDRSMSELTTCYCSYFVASRDFWDGYLSFLDQICRALDQLPPHLAEVLNGSAGYRRDEALSLFPFIIERMFSTYLLIAMPSIWHRPYDYGLYREEIPDKVDLLHGVNLLRTQTDITADETLFKSWDAIRQFLIRDHRKLFNLD